MQVNDAYAIAALRVGEWVHTHPDATWPQVFQFPSNAPPNQSDCSEAPSQTTNPAEGYPECIKVGQELICLPSGGLDGPLVGPNCR